MSNSDGTSTLPISATRPEVVAEHVDDHQVLGPVLLRRVQAWLPAGRRRPGSAPALAVPFIGRVVMKPVLEAEEQLRRRRGHREAAEVHEGRRGAVAARRPGGRTGAKGSSRRGALRGKVKLTW